MKFAEIAPGVKMPMMGIGTWEVTNPTDLRNIIDSGLSAGYRFIDSAASYGNEADIGIILKELLPKYGLKREDIFITSKLSARDHGKGKAREAALKSVKNLGFDYIDLYIIHFPGCSNLNSKDPENRTKRMESWLELEKLQKEGKFKAIGVSNYMVQHLEEMTGYSSYPPALNQCEFHPHCVNQPLVNYCSEKGIHFQAYSSLGSKHNKQKLFSEKLINELAQKYSCSVAQLLLAWSLNQNISVLPKSYNPDHVKANLAALDIKMDQSDVEALASLSKGARYCWDPTVVV